LITNALEAPKSFTFPGEEKAFSGKGFMHAKAEGNGVIIVTVSQNAFGVKENAVSGSEEVKIYL
jgi:electron transfer flavoprotein alpha subunit